MTTDEQNDGGVELRAEWVNDTRVPLVMAMQTHVGSLGAYEGVHLITFGQYDVPIPIGETDAERRAYMKESGPVPLRVVGRFAMLDKHFREFSDELVNYLGRLDRLAEASE